MLTEVVAEPTVTITSDPIVNLFSKTSPIGETNSKTSPIGETNSKTSPIGETGLERYAYDDGAVMVGTDEPDLIQRTESKNYSKEERRRQRMKACGKPGKWHINPVSGAMVRSYQRCKTPGCPNCDKVYAIQKITGAIRLIESDQAVYYFELPSHVLADAFSRTTTKEHYKKIKLQDGTAILLTDNTVNFTAQATSVITTKEELLKYDWINISFNRATYITGKLGAEPELELEAGPDAIDFTFIDYHIIACKPGSPAPDAELLVPSNAEASAIQAAALEATADLDPHTAEELTDALMQRTEALATAFKEAGWQVSILPIKRTLKIRLLELRWLYSRTHYIDEFLDGSTKYKVKCCPARYC